MFLRKNSFFAFAAVMLLTAGCVSQVEEVPEDFGHIKLKRPKNVVYEQISTQGMELAVAPEVQAVSGSKQTIDLQLINRSKRHVIIQEWYMVDQYNFRVFYRKLPSDRPLDPAVKFKEHIIKIPRKPMPQHAELQLLPGNRAVLTIELPFIGELNPGENAAFEVFITTSLNTFKIKSQTFMVYAR